MPNPKGGLTGDLLVQTFIETPKKISNEQEELLRKLAELEHTEVLPERKEFPAKDYGLLCISRRLSTEQKTCSK